jgi:hypothetical protein
MSKSTKTFWEIISNFSIVVPVIQRDYVQGRKTKQIENARNMLLDELKDSVIGGHPVSLNFVYGKAAQKGGRAEFLPIDGQQRLTTLFLLHWYALSNSSTRDEAQYDVLAGFSYETRKTSRDFFDRITDPILVSDIDTGLAGGKISDQIVDKYWFRPEWRADPTVKSSLIVIDEIQDRFSDVEGLWELLIDEEHCPIRFEWLNIESLGNEDDLYIKMNARGKLLSDFENLKAELQKASCSVISEEDSVAFFTKLDGEWLDYFWKNCGKESSSDQSMMRLFHWSLWNQWCIAKTDYEVKYSGNEDGVLSLQDKTECRTLDDYSKAVDVTDVASAEFFKGMEYLLDHVCSTEADADIESFVMNCTKANVGYHERILLLSAFEYMLGQNGVFEEESWRKWKRIMVNLSNCSSRYQGFNTLGQFMNATKCVRRLRPHSGDLVRAFADLNIQIEGFVPAEQIEEERIKAKLILHSNLWEDAITEAEAVGYFRGKVGFLLFFSGLSLYDQPTEENFALFRKYSSATQMIFGEEGPVCSENLLIRAILTKGDFALVAKQLRCYMITDNRTIDWRAFLRYYNAEHTNANAKFKLLLEDISERFGNIKERLEGVIEDYTWDAEREDWYARYFIECPELLDQEVGSRHQHKLSGWSAMPLCFLPVGNNTVASGNNRELYTSLIAIKARKTGWNTVSTPVLGTQSGRLYSLDKGSHHYSLHIADWRSDKALLLRDSSGTEEDAPIIATNSYEEILDYLNGLE